MARKTSSFARTSNPTPRLSPSPGSDSTNDDAWLRFFLTASDAQLRAVERAVVG